MPEPLHEQFRVWLSPQRACGFIGDPEAKPNSGIFTFQDNKDHYTIIRVRKNANFDYLYSQGTYNGDSIERSGNFEYAGIYC
jgi:hypothetical protein